MKAFCVPRRRHLYASGHFTRVYRNVFDTCVHVHADVDETSECRACDIGGELDVAIAHISLFALDVLISQESLGS